MCGHSMLAVEKPALVQVEMKETIDRERRITAAVRQLKNDLKDEKADHEEKVR